MRHWLFVLCVGVLAGCSDKPSLLPTGALERPPLERLPDDLKPPVQ
ncbi:hypothetical protein EJ065_5462 [Corallococcus coralloides]|uniref:Lipoprotein n=1 Tax=Corallococcus coralloides TaxID=184914 RepID=A0A410RYR8_CORCK|nr:hypothetical protein [Corallococcus coralloides]QAT86996.1 hypothetical protein EJ065_5462 [Corallococcus coralloides]